MKNIIVTLVLIAFFFALCSSVKAQQPLKMTRLAYMGPGSPTATPGRREALLQALRDHGYVEGKNLVIEYRWAEGKPELLQEQAAQLVSLKPDVIFTVRPKARWR